MCDWRRRTRRYLAIVTASTALSLGSALTLSAQPTSVLAAPAQPVATLSARSLDFGVQTLGSTRAMSITLGNVGSGDLHLRAISGLSGNFGATGTCLAAPKTLAPGMSCVALFSFSPSVFGQQQASVHFLDDAAGSQTVTLVGRGTASIIEADATKLDFGTVFVGTTAKRVVTLKNRGDTDLRIAGISVASDAFSETDTCRAAAIAPASSCVISALFTPRAASTLSVDMRIDSNAIGGPLLLRVTGSGTVSLIAMRAEPLAFGQQPVGTYAVRSFVVTNTGADDLLVRDVALADNSSDFTITSDGCGSHALPPATSCAIIVRFWPSQAGEETNALVVHGNMPGGGATFALTGSGLPPVSLTVQAGTPRAAALSAITARVRLWRAILGETSYLSATCLLASLWIATRRRGHRAQTALALAAPGAPVDLSASTELPERAQV